jgi:D-threo-aldose 1-dehydrogenase
VSFSLADRRHVGRTTLELPVLGFGAAHIGELYGKVTETDSRATLDAAWAAGIRYYDTAPWYGRGLSEHRLGGFLRTQERSDFCITTKVGRTLHRPKDPRTFDRGPWVGGLNFEVHFDYSYDGIMRSYEQALQRLALDTIDALVIHDLDVLYHGPELQASHEKHLQQSGIKALEELKSSGQIRAFGMGINTRQAFEDVAPLVPLDFCLVALPYTMLDQSSLETGMQRCIDNNISVIIGAPFASGILVTGSGEGAKYAYGKAAPEIQAKVQGMEAVCAAHNVKLPVAALQFVLAHPAVAAAIPGAAKPSEVTANAASISAPIPADFWAELKARGLIHPDAPVPA